MTPSFLNYLQVTKRGTHFLFKYKCIKLQLLETKILLLQFSEFSYTIKKKMYQNFTFPICAK